MILSACQNDSADTRGIVTQITDYPELPEEVIRQYQASIDSNRFEQAKLLSTVAGKNWIDTLSRIINSSGDDMDSTLLQTQFVQIDCQMKVDTAICNCLANDRDGSYEILYTLIREENKWKVDAPEEEDLWIDEELIQEMIKQLIEK